MSGYAVIDVETTGLQAMGMHRIWEFGAVLADDAGAVTAEVEFQIELLDSEIRAADHRALDVGRFDERYAPYLSAQEGVAMPPRVVREYQAGREIQDALRGRQVIAQPALFDVGFVKALLYRHSLIETWSHRAVHDLKTWACAYESTRELFAMRGGPIPARALSTDDLMELAGVDVPGGRHTAIVDARLTLAVARKLGAVP